MGDLAQLDNIISRLRKVKYGDMILDSDHNDLVDAVTTIRDILKAGGVGAQINPSGYHVSQVLKKFYDDIKLYYGFDMDGLKDHANIGHVFNFGIDDLINVIYEPYYGLGYSTLPEILSPSTFGLSKPPITIYGYPTYLASFVQNRVLHRYDLINFVVSFRIINSVKPFATPLIGLWYNKGETPYDSISINAYVEIIRNGIGVQVHDNQLKQDYNYYINIDQDIFLDWTFVVLFVHGRNYVSPDYTFSAERCLIVAVYDKNLNLLGTIKHSLYGSDAYFENRITAIICYGQAEGGLLRTSTTELTTNVAFEYDWILVDCAEVEYELAL